MADNILSYDANSAQQYIRTTETGGVHVPHSIIDSMPSMSLSFPDDATIGINALPAGMVDSFGHMVTGTVNNQIDVQFYRGTVAALTTLTTANGGSGLSSGGMGTWACTTTANSSAKSVSLTSTVYSAYAEIYCVFTAAFTGAGGGTSYQRIGLYDANNGLFIGREGATFKFTKRKGAVDTGVAFASWNGDPLDGSVDSAFTRDGAPEAIDLTKLNVWRIAFGWVGSAPLKLEVLSPDGKWIRCHTFLQPNSEAVPSLENADLPMTCDVNGGNSGLALSILSNCWCAGTTQALSKISASLGLDALAGLTRAVITGQSTAGGSFVNVKVNPSGAVSIDGAVTGPLTNTELRATAVPVSAPTLTKGTQSANGFPVQNLKDSGRVNLIFWATGVASGTTGTETAITLERRPDQGAGSSAASFAITSGKRFRITSIVFAARGHNTATAQVTTFKFRVNTAGAVGTTSTPIVLQARVATPATANSWDRLIVPIPDGFELVGDGTAQFGVTAAATFTTNAPTWDVLITGFEY